MSHSMWDVPRSGVTRVGVCGCAHDLNRAACRSCEGTATMYIVASGKKQMC